MCSAIQSASYYERQSTCTQRCIMINMIIHKLTAFVHNAMQLNCKNGSVFDSMDQQQHNQQKKRKQTQWYCKCYIKSGICKFFQTMLMRDYISERCLFLQTS